MQQNSSPVVLIPKGRGKKEKEEREGGRERRR